MNFRNKLKGFTLVEMLIVIVIIGVLAAALIPRLTSVRGRANDVARKADLQQIATAIVSYSMDKGTYPTTTGSTTGISINLLSGLLQNYVSSLPEDPTTNSTFDEYHTITGSVDGNYAYLTIEKGGSDNQGFALISYAETEGGANRLYSGGAIDLTGGLILNSYDAQDITPCKTLEKTDSTFTLAQNGDCKYFEDSQLRYIIVR